MEDKGIMAVKQWPKPQSIQVIQVFFGLTNFYCQFIKGFSLIVALLTSILKTLGSTKSSTQPGEGVVRVGNKSRAGHDRSKLNKGEIDDGEVGGGEVGDEVEKKEQKTSKSKKSSKSKKTVGSSDFFTLRAKLKFIKLRQVFLQALIFYHFELEDHIRIEIDVSGYAIGRLFSQLALNNSS